MVARHYGIGDDALSFYHFEQIAKPKPYKDGYRARLDALELDPAAQEAVAEVAGTAFELNRAVFADLERARSEADGDVEGTRDPAA